MLLQAVSIRPDGAGATHQTSMEGSAEVVLSGSVFRRCSAGQGGCPKRPASQGALASLRRFSHHVTRRMESLVIECGRHVGSLRRAGEESLKKAAQGSQFGLWHNHDWLRGWRGIRTAVLGTAGAQEEELLELI